MPDDDWKRDGKGQVRALRPGDSPPVSSLYEAFDGRDVSAADAIVLRGYLARSDRIQRVREYLERSLRIAETDAASTMTTSLARRFERVGPPNWWGDTRDIVHDEIIDAAMEAAGLTPQQRQKVTAARGAALDPGTAARVANAQAAADALEAGGNDVLADVVRGAAQLMPAQARADALADALTRWPDRIDDHDRARQLASSLSGAEVAELRQLLISLEAVTRLAEPHLPWRLYLTPRLDRYVDFHQSSLIAWRREPKADRQDACTVWLRVFEKGAQVPILYRLVSETNLVPSFAAWINGQLMDDYGDGVVESAWGEQTSGLKGTGPRCLKGTTRLCMD